MHPLLLAEYARSVTEAKVRRAEHTYTTPRVVERPRPRVRADWSRW